MSPASNGDAIDPGHQPDLQEEVTTLSTKLIHAINHQTHLDDTLSATRHELDNAYQRIQELETQNASQREILSGDVWVRKSTIEPEKSFLNSKIAEEKAKRAETEGAKKKIEQELENLTTALFEEANQMVIRAKENAQAEHEVLQRKNDLLKAQLADSEGLLKSQQEQLSELKHVMETITSDRDDLTNTNPTAPSSPGMARFDMRDDDRETDVASPNAVAVAPAHPTSFHHVIQPILRTDLGAYDDFVALSRTTRNASGSRVSSGSLGGLALPSLGLGVSAGVPSNNSVSSLHAATQGTNNSAPQSPNTPGFGSPSPGTPLPSLRETKFFKRVLVEDIEPTLRLDAAPGLSWLARRSVMSAMSDGTLVVDPVTTHAGNRFLMSIAKPQHHPCSLCGETRKDAQYLRNHRFRTNEQESSQRYPLCRYCLGRVRSTCDFLSFLRMVKDGHWRADDDDQEKAAWEESVRLRDQMFWARLGGGVIPCVQNLGLEVPKSPRPSEEQKKNEIVVAKAITEEEDEAEETKSDQVDDNQEDAKPVVSVDSPVNVTKQEPSTPPTQIEGANNRFSAQSLGTKSNIDADISPRPSLSITTKE